MKFDNLNISYTDFSTILIEWNYQPYNGISTNNYIIKISVAGTKTGPFKLLAELPSNTIFYTHKREKKKWLDLYYKVEIVNTFDDIITDEKVINVELEKDVLVQRSRQKYKLYLSKKVKKEGYFLKRKKTGDHCRECWDPLKEKITKSKCPTCYETSYGNDGVLGLQNITTDGWLKVNTDGDLEFYHRHSLFGSYPAINNQLTGDIGEDFGVFPGDEFRIEKSDGTPLFSFPILEVQSNSLIMKYGGEDIYDSLNNAEFTIYRLKKLREDLTIKVKIVDGPDAINFYHDGLNFTLDYKKVVFLNSEEIIQTTFDIENQTDHFHLTDGNVNAIRACDRYYFLDTDDTIISSHDIETLFLSIAKNNYLMIPGTSYDINHRFYILYQYDGVNKAIVDTYNTTISDSDTPKESLALFSIVEQEYTGTYVIDIQTLSNYEPILEDGVDLTLYNTCIEHFISSILHLSVFESSYAKAHQQMQFRLDKREREILLPHRYILKTGFAGCGVIMIDTIKGKTYKGSDWDDITGEYTGVGDFYVNPDTGVLNTLNLPDSNYEIAYIYDVRGLRFNTHFAPIRPVIEDNKITDVDGWYFKSPKLIGKKLKTDVVLSVKGSGYYKELEIDTFEPTTGVLHLKKYDGFPEILFSSLNRDSDFSLDYKNTGGYYTKIRGWINNIVGVTKQEQLDPSGIIADLYTTILTEYYPTFEPNDVVYNINSGRFFTVIKVEVRDFRSRITYQTLTLKEKPYDEQIMLKSLITA